MTQKGANRFFRIAAIVSYALLDAALHWYVFVANRALHYVRECGMDRVVTCERPGAIYAGILVPILFDGGPLLIWFVLWFLHWFARLPEE
jgi:hypothetical protein